MTARSRRSRRSIPQSRKISAGPGIAGPSLKGQDSTLVIKTEDYTTFRAKPAQLEQTDTKQIWKELQMIGLVTAIVLVLLVISFFLFK
jgi:hypothetical protein